MTSDSTSSPPSLQGRKTSAADKAELLHALDQAFDYRGDVTLTLTDGRTIEGYIFDRRTGQGLEDSRIRLIPVDAEQRMEIFYDQIAWLEFSGKDAAHGKSWENWVKRYIEKKLAGQKASIDSDNLE